MGILCENYETGDPIGEDGLNILVNPEDSFSHICINKHHIDQNTVVHAKTFSEVWEEVKSYFEDSIIIAHNAAGADLDALVKCLLRYDLAVPHFRYVDTMQIAKQEMGPAFGTSLRNLCEEFGIEYDDTQHDAFDHAQACRELFFALRNVYRFTLEDYVRDYNPRSDFHFQPYISNRQLCKDIGELYGIIQGIYMDSELSGCELKAIQNWYQKHTQYAEETKVSEILALTKEILDDNVITPKELQKLHGAMGRYYKTLSASDETTAVQILQGVLKGISVDGITAQECQQLRAWLYQYEDLCKRFAFNEIKDVLDSILADNRITNDEILMLQSKINEVLDPLATIKTHLDSVAGKTVCLSGTFTHGTKAEIQNIVEKNGGIVVKNVTRALNILLVGDEQCPEYAYGTHGKKTERARDFIRKGYSINIITEKGFFEMIETK